MICQNSDMETLHQPGQVIQHYRIIEVLGQGGLGITYLAEDLQRGEKVALKTISLRRVDDFKVLELFEREARILAQLNYPAIPRYLDYFQIDKPRNRSFYIVQQLADGKPLTDLVEAGWQPDETEVKAIATQILEILIYLQQLIPPVIHRDIKPQNIIRRQDGQVFLVDFGAVQDTYHNTMTGGSTVVGTFGYMAPEQFRGQAVLATDLYGLGATLLYLLTQKAPADLPQRKLKIDFRAHVNISQAFADWLERMIEPVAEDRFHSAEEALAVLRGEKEFQQAPVRPRRPANSPITLTRTEEKLTAQIPPIWLRTRHSTLFALLPIVWNTFGLALLWLTLDAGIVAGLQDSRVQLLLLLLFLGGFEVFGAWSIVKFLLGAALQTQLEVNREYFRLQRKILGWVYQEIKGNTIELAEVKLNKIGVRLNQEPITTLTVVRLNRKPVKTVMRRSRLQKYRFGSFLTEAEKQWLAAEVNDFLAWQKEDSDHSDLQIIQ
jgi:eukaryotic-like serine/threonine-protein kinase